VGNAEPVFHRYRKGGCHSGGSQLEDVLMDIFSSLPFPAGIANIPKNVIKRDVFYRTEKPKKVARYQVKQFGFYRSEYIRFRIHEHLVLLDLVRLDLAGVR